MELTEGLRSTPHRRVRIWKIVIIVVLLAAIGEPLVMYRVLVAEKEKRQASAQLVVPVSAHTAAVE
jgi:hypothetical protein